jgi:hypothetical protein
MVEETQVDGYLSVGDVSVLRTWNIFGHQDHSFGGCIFDLQAEVADRWNNWEVRMTSLLYCTKMAALNMC